MDEVAGRKEKKQYIMLWFVQDSKSENSMANFLIDEKLALTSPPAKETPSPWWFGDDELLNRQKCDKGKSQN